MTHEYTLLLGATVLPGRDASACEAIAWAAGVVIALGSEDAVRAISRGDSYVLEYPGAFAVPMGEALEIGGPADLDLLDHDPRQATTGSIGATPRRIARFVGGHLVRS